MRFIEWWGESVDPGKVGSVDFSADHEPCRCRALVLARFLFVVIGLPVVWYLTVPHVPLPIWQAVVLVIGGTLIYVALSYLADPAPDLENLGPAGGPGPADSWPSRYSTHGRYSMTTSSPTSR
jgi:hypothetical protein